MASLPILKWRALDANGDPISGAKLYFYTAGTTNALDTYSDEALSSANANPVVADGDGWFGEIYMKKNTAYKVKYTDASDVQIWVVDNINAGELTSSSFSTRLQYLSSDPILQGAVGDGVADESTEVQAAINAATGTVDLLGKTYRCDSALTLKANMTLRNGSLNFTNCTDNNYIVIQGSTGTPTLLTANAARGATAVTVTSATGLAADDWVHIYSDAFWTGAAGAAVGDIVEITSVSSPTVNFLPELESAMNTADNAALAELTFMSRVVLDNLQITCNSAASGTGVAILVDRGQDIEIRNCKVITPKLAAIRVDLSQNVLIDNCRVSDSATYGFLVDSARDVEIRSAQAISCASAGFQLGRNTGTGVARNTVIDKCYSAENVGGIECSSNSQYIKIRDCTIKGVNSSDHGILNTGGFFEATGNTITGCDLDGIEYTASATNVTVDYVKITDNNIYDCTPAAAGGCIMYTGHASATVDLVEIHGNRINATDTSAKGINCTLAGTTNRFLISDNDIDVAALALNMTGNATTKHVNVSGNYITCSGDNGCTVIQDISRVHFVNNYVDSTKAALTGVVAAIVFNNANDTLISGVVVGNTVPNNQNQFTHALKWTSITTGGKRLVIANNNFSALSLTSGSTYGVVELDSLKLEQLVCVGNVIEATIGGGTEGDGIEANGATGTDLASAVFTGNSFDGCDYGIRVSNVGEAIHSGNAFASMATGEITGTFDQLHMPPLDVSVAAGAAVTVASLEQLDDDDTFIDFVGTSAASAAKSISSWTAGNSIQGFVKVDVNGSAYWIPYYDAPTS